ncbi:renalase-like [Daktulosphaira vitifoliae]|uniref:renalase-like n=1 Tax=Daktulosphaira vitifoliae TaxID=58002 RepID=UPI0021AAF305|nr:renalase-like [Daktulosphaira vitifoliae]
MNVLLVGCGFTSTLTAFLLRSKYPNIHLTLWDKARGPGGRASVRRGPNETFVDLGTQFITTNNSIISKYSVIYNMLISSNNLVPMMCKVIGMRESPDDKHFIAPNGTSSVVKYLLDNSKVNDIKFGRRICTILPTGNVKCIDGYEQTFDLIIITNPIPQILELECPILQTGVLYYIKNQYR